MVEAGIISRERTEEDERVQHLADERVQKCVDDLLKIAEVTGVVFAVGCGYGETAEYTKNMIVVGQKGVFRGADNKRAMVSMSMALMKMADDDMDEEDNYGLC